MRAALPPLALLGLLAPLAPGPALAQVCAGVPLDERPVALSAGYATSDGVTGWGAGFDGRVEGPLVVSGSAARYDYAGTEVNVWQAGGGVGWEIGLGPARLCPRAALAYAWPDDDGFEIDAWTGSATLALGHAVGLGAARALGFAEAGVAVTRAATGEASATSTDGVAALGATLAGSRLFGSATLELTTAEQIDPLWGLAVGVLLP